MAGHRSVHSRGLRALGHRSPISPLLLLVVAGCLLFSSCNAGEGASPALPPNVILIVMDTASGERCSVNGYARETTPFLETLAAEGLNFRNAWSPAGWTGPAHASLFTGLRPENHGFRRSNRNYLRKDATTLAEVLHEAGYRTGCFTNNPIISAEHGLMRGFAEEVPLYAYEGLVYPTAIPTHAMAVDWLRRGARTKTPYFLFINDMEPHFAYTPPKEFAERFAGREVPGDVIEEAAQLTHTDLFRHNVGMVPIRPRVVEYLSDLYDAEIACLDHEIGRLVEKLRTMGLLENTLLIITSDHGENLGRHGLLEHMFSLHRTICHVPLIVRLPGGERAGEVRDEVVRLEDLLPTILEVCGLPIPRSLDGESILGDLGGRRARALLDHSETYFDRMEREIGGRPGFETRMVDIRADFDGRRHTIEYSDGRRLIFDILEDPEELHPLPE